MTNEGYNDEPPEKAATALADELERRLKKDIHDEVMEPLHRFLQEIKGFYETALHEAVAEQDRVVEMLKDRLLSQQGAKAELHQEVARLEKELETVLHEKKSAEDEEDNMTIKALQDQLHEAIDLAEAALDEKSISDEKKRIALMIGDEAEKKFHQANNVNRTLNDRLNSYRRELDAAVVLAETFLREKNRLEGRLNRLIDNS